MYVYWYGIRSCAQSDQQRGYPYFFDYLMPWFSSCPQMDRIHFTSVSVMLHTFKYTVFIWKISVEGETGCTRPLTSYKDTPTALNVLLDTL